MLTKLSYTVGIRPGVFLNNQRITDMYNTTSIYHNFLRGLRKNNRQKISCPGTILSPANIIVTLHISVAETQT